MVVAQTNAVAAVTDVKGHFEISVFEGTAYRIHAMEQFTNQRLYAEPLPFRPGAHQRNAPPGTYSERIPARRFDGQRLRTLARGARLLNESTGDATLTLRCHLASS